MADKRQTARLLAESHYRTDQSIVRIVTVMAGPEAEARPSEPVKLLEVNEATVPLGIRPLGFSAQPEGGIDFPSVIVEVTPDEFQEIRAGRLPLPNGWRLGEEIPRPAEVESER